jgi:hypothetical protein
MVGPKLMRTHLWYVQETSRATYESTTGEVQLRYRLYTSFVQRPRSVCQAFTAFKDLGKEWVVLHALDVNSGPRNNVEWTTTHLELLVWRQVWVLVIQPNDQTQADHVIFHVVEPTTPVRLVIHWPP